MTSPSLFDRATDHMIALQESILAAVEELEGGATFRRDDWQREEGRRRRRLQPRCTHPPRLGSHPGHRERPLL